MNKMRELKFSETDYGGLFCRTNKGTELSVRTSPTGEWYHTFRTIEDLKWMEDNTFIPPKFQDETFHRDAYMTRTEAADGLMSVLSIMYPTYEWSWVVEE